MGGVKAELGSVKDKPFRFHSQQWLNTGSRRAPTHELVNTCRQVGWKRHSSTQELGRSVTSLLDKALCLSHTAVKFTFSLLKWPVFLISVTFTLIKVAWG